MKKENLKKCIGLINPNKIVYVGTYTKDKCKVEDLINSQYVVLEHDNYNIAFPFKYCHFKEGKLVITLLRDKEYSIWNKKEKKAINATGIKLISLFEFEEAKFEL